MCDFLTHIEDKPVCSLNNFDDCPFEWWCTHDNRWKEYDGMNHCGLSCKYRREGWFAVSYWEDNVAVCKNGNQWERFYVDIVDDKYPVVIKPYGDKIVDMIFD